MKITEEDFWFNFWKNVELPSNIDYTRNSDSIIANTIKSFLPKNNAGKKSAEIGCAPGKWLVFLNKELGYNVDGYDYFQYAVEKTIENLKLSGVEKEKFNVFNADFTKDKIDKKYDLVISLGFIEHFENYDEILYKHYELLNENGFLVIGIPNFMGFNHYFQYIIDLFIPERDKLLPNHNTKVMNLDLYKNFAKKYNLKEHFCNYVGGFEASLFPINKINNKIVKTILKIIRRLVMILFSNPNKKVISGYIMVVLSKN